MHIQLAGAEAFAAAESAKVAEQAIGDHLELKADQEHSAEDSCIDHALLRTMIVQVAKSRLV
eukprot:COSAG02_NODE_24_length_52386_cov_726.042898_35_plen_62_part_00